MVKKSSKKSIEQTSAYSSILSNVVKLINEARKITERSINAIMTALCYITYKPFQICQTVSGKSNTSLMLKGKSATLLRESNQKMQILSMEYKTILPDEKLIEQELNKTRKLLESNVKWQY